MIFIHLINTFIENLLLLGTVLAIVTALVIRPEREQFPSSHGEHIWEEVGGTLWAIAAHSQPLWDESQSVCGPRNLTLTWSCGKWILTDLHWEQMAVFLGVTHISKLLSRFDVWLFLKEKEKKSKDHKLVLDFCHFIKWLMLTWCS